MWKGILKTPPSCQVRAQAAQGHPGTTPLPGPSLLLVPARLSFYFSLYSELKGSHFPV